MKVDNTNKAVYSYQHCDVSIITQSLYLVEFAFGMRLCSMRGSERQESRETYEGGRREGEEDFWKKSDKVGEWQGDKTERDITA